MTTTLLLLILLATAVAMPLWMARCRKRGGDSRRWVLPWLATLLPLGTVVLLHSLNLMAGLSTTVTLPLIAVAVLGLAAFLGGALYLGIPRVLATLKETRLRVVAAEPKRKREDEDVNDSMVPNGYCISSSGNHYEPIDYGDEESDDYYRNGKPV
ncbi:MAG: hypothetical protein L3K25_07670 [Gammaproteobacteria bacterium]|nr:hypothetical protein [Gammaproteobacteria bacterium]